MKPIFVNNSKIPVILSKFSPIDIWAITIFPFVFCKGVMNKVTMNHEAIHIAQYNELFVLGFLAIYLIDYLHGLVKYRNDYEGFGSASEKAYYRIRAEQEAYEFERDYNYLDTRVKRGFLTKYKV